MGVAYFIRNKCNQILNRLSFIGKNVQVGEKVQINGYIQTLTEDKSKIIIGNKVRINSGKRYNIIGGDTRTALVACKTAQILIGDNTGISNSTIVSMSAVKIGKNVKIGGSCKIYDTDFHSLNYLKRRENALSDIKAAMVTIGDDVFVGAHSIILKGVTIGSRSIIGAGSVVTKNVPEDEIWAGNPAKFIRSLKEKDCEN